MACRHDNALCRDSRLLKNGVRWRRYYCQEPGCGERWTTVELELDGVQAGRKRVDQLEDYFRLTEEQRAALKTLFKVFGDVI